MNIQQLEYIVALDQYKNFSIAAEHCFVTQATLSTMIKKLEIELNVVLFDRKTTPIITTECGKEIVDEAKKVIFGVKHITSISQTIKGNIEGEIKIGVIPTVATNLLKRTLPQILEKYKKLNIEIFELNTENIVERLRNGKLDTGIISTPYSNKEFEEIILYYEKLLVYGENVNKEYEYTINSDLFDSNLWLLSEENCLSTQINKLCNLEENKLQSNLKYKPTHLNSLINLVDQFKGITIIPELYYYDLEEERKKKVADFKTPFPVREISMIYYRPFAKLRLIDALSKEIKNIISPLLKTKNINNSDLQIVKS